MNPGHVSAHSYNSAKNFGLQSYSERSCLFRSAYDVLFHFPLIKMELGQSSGTRGQDALQTKA